MGRNQLLDKVNFLGADPAASINKFALHDRQFRPPNLERKGNVAFFYFFPEPRAAKPSVQSNATSEPPELGWGCRSRAATGVDAHPDPAWPADRHWATSQTGLAKGASDKASNPGHHSTKSSRPGAVDSRRRTTRPPSDRPKAFGGKPAPTRRCLCGNRPARPPITTAS